MRDHWKEVIDTFQALASLVKLVDDDGLDLYFASSPKKMHHNKHSGPLVDIIKKQRLEQPCMMNLSLDAMTEIIIEKHLGFRVHRRRPVSVFVLTNGNWGLGGVDKSVERLVRELDKHDTADSFVALQFVRFGSLPEGIRRLKKLDNLGKPSSKNPSKKVLSRSVHPIVPLPQRYRLRIPRLTMSAETSSTTALAMTAYGRCLSVVSLTVWIMIPMTTRTWTRA